MNDLEPPLCVIKRVEIALRYGAYPRLVRPPRGDEVCGGEEPSVLAQLQLWDVIHSTRGPEHGGSQDVPVHAHPLGSWKPRENLFHNLLQHGYLPFCYVLELGVGGVVSYRPEPPQSFLVETLLLPEDGCG